MSFGVLTCEPQPEPVATMKRECSTNIVCSIFSKFTWIACFILLLSGGRSLYSEVEEVIPDSEFSIQFSYNPVFPASLKSEGVMEGVVKVVVSVDAKGQLKDWVVTNATHRSFAKSIEQSIGDWIFEPPIKNGFAEGITVPVEVLFSIEGTLIISPSMMSIMRSEYDLGLISERDVIAEYSVKDLDQLPAPLSIERPVVPIELLGDGAKEAIFEFYIDHRGDARLPILRSRDLDIDDRVLWIVQETIRSWRFTPPTVENNPAVVKVAQKLVFSKDQ